jgi:hypothetical protein
LKLTGEPKELLLLLKTKVNAVHAGPSLLLLPTRAIKSNSKTNQTPSVSVSNNSSIAPTSPPMRTTAAMEDTELELWSTSRISDKPPLPTIPILPRMDHALCKEDHTDLSALLKATDAMKLKKSSSEDLWLLELMQATGIFTRVEFSTTAPRTSTTLCSWLALVSQPGLSKTVGDQLGENQATSVLPREILALFAKVHLSQSDTNSSLSPLLFMNRLKSTIEKMGKMNTASNPPPPASTSIPAQPKQ